MTVVFNKSDMLIMIGAGLLQMKAIAEAKTLGLTVLGMDMNPHADGVPECDVYEQVSTRDIEALIACAKRYGKDYTIRGVMTAGTDMAYSVACVSEALGLPGLSPDDALHATNKYLMRGRLAEHGVRVPRFIRAETREEAMSGVQEIGYPCVIKPVDNMGARGVRRIDSAEELRRYFDESLSMSGFYESPSVVIEEYMEGDEISMDTIVVGGQVHLVTVADRHISYPPYFVETGHSIPSQLTQEERDDAFDTMCAAIRAIGITNGAAKGDIKITKEGAKIGEITARLSGGFHSQCTEYLATGMNSTRAAVLLATGMALDYADITAQWSRVAIERAVIAEPGVVTAITGVEEAKALDGIAEVIINVKEGDVVYPIRSNIGKVANIIAVADTFEEAEASVARARDVLCVETDVYVSDAQLLS